LNEDNKRNRRKNKGTEYSKGISKEKLKMAKGTEKR
jgi:hypothetical protein